MKSTEGERLAQLRCVLGLTQDEFAKKVRVSHGYICSLEQNRRPLNPRIIKLIADSFGVNEAWLETGQGEMFTGKQDQDLAEIIDLFGKLHPKLKKLVIEQLEVLLDMSAEARQDGAGGG